MSKPQTPTYEGNLDGVTHEVISGWAWDKDQPNTAIVVDIYDGSILIGAAKADQFREDLKKHGIGDGKHGFSFPAPSVLKDGKRHLIFARFSGTNIRLQNAGIPFTTAAKQNAGIPLAATAKPM